MNPESIFVNSEPFLLKMAYAKVTRLILFDEIRKPSEEDCCTKCSKVRGKGFAETELHHLIDDVVTQRDLEKTRAYM